MKSKLCYTAGDPHGIGMDIILQICQQQVLDDVIVIACLQNLKARAEKIGLNVKFLSEMQKANSIKQLVVKDFPLGEVVNESTSKASIANQVIRLIDEAIDGCQTGRYSAMVTGPLNKALINDAGIQFSVLHYQ